jgi:hypothetical protein
MLLRPQILEDWMVNAVCSSVVPAKIRVVRASQEDLQRLQGQPTVPGQG